MAHNESPAGHLCVEPVARGPWQNRTEGHKVAASLGWLGNMIVGNASKWHILGQEHLREILQVFHRAEAGDPWWECEEGPVGWARHVEVPQPRRLPPHLKLQQ